MTTTDIAIRGDDLPAKIDYARFLAKADLLPRAYQDKPANLLYAIEYGAMLGLPPIAAIVGIHVIDGRPTMSAGLMAAKVRQAGHKIRVQSTGEGDQAKARCTITRSDDPTFEYSATWTMDRAKTAGLLGKTNWRQHPVQMLKNRAISECCRDACQEVLLGVHYTPDELGGEDDGGEVVHDGWPTQPNGMVNGAAMSEQAKDAAGLMTREQRVEHAELREMNKVDPGDVEVVTEADDADPWAVHDEQPTPAPESWQKSLISLLGSLPLGDDDAVRDLLSWLAGRRVAQVTDLSRSEVRTAGSVVKDHVKRAEGDVEMAATALWKQYHEAQNKAGDE